MEVAVVVFGNLIMSLFLISPLAPPLKNKRGLGGRYEPLILTLIPCRESYELSKERPRLEREAKGVTPESDQLRKGFLGKNPKQAVSWDEVFSSVQLWLLYSGFLLSGEKFGGRVGWWAA